MKTLFPRLATAVLVAMVFSFPARAADSPSVLLQKGIYAEETEGNVDAAIKIYEQIAAEAATNRAVLAQVQYRLAVCYQKKGNKEQAVRLLNELVQQFSTDAGITKRARDTLADLGEHVSPTMTVRRVTLPVSSDWFMRITADGRYFTYQPKDTDNIAVCDVATGKSWTVFKGTAEKSPDREAIISPDGQWVAYDISGKTINVAKIDGSEARQLYACDPKMEGSSTGAKSWSADSTKLIVGVWFKTEPNLALSLDVKAGVRKEIARVPQPKAGPDISWTLSENGRFMARQTGQYPRMIVIRELKSAHEEIVVDHDAGGVVGWFQGDTKLLFKKNRGTSTDLWVVDVKDGNPVGEPELLRSNQGNFSSLGITSDGSIFYSVRKNKPEPPELWVMEGFLTKKAPVANKGDIQSEIPPAELFGPNNTIHDRQAGFSAALPAGWTVKSAMRRANAVASLLFTVSDVSDASAGFNFHVPTPGGEPPDSGITWLNAVGSLPTTPVETEAYVRKFAAVRIKLAQGMDKNAKYQSRAESLATRTIDGHTAVSWLADYTRDGKAWVEYMTFIYGTNGGVGLPLQVPAEKLDAIRPAWDRFIESVRLPK